MIAQGKVQDMVDPRDPGRRLRLRRCALPWADLFGPFGAELNGAGAFVAASCSRSQSIRQITR